jgi:hypothetical protein
MRKLMLFVALTLLTVAIQAGPTAAGEVTTVDGVPVVANTDQPRDGVVDMKLTELWRRGGDDDEVFFGLVLKALSDDEGNVYLLDQQLSEVKVFDPEGELIKTLSREGDGPGEVRQPTDMLWMPDGTLGIVQTFPGRIIKVDREGLPAGDYKTGEEGAIVAMVEARQGGGNLVIGSIDIEVAPAGQTRHLYIASFDESGVEQARYTGFTVTWDFSDMVFREREQYFVLFGKWDLMRDGRVIAVPDFYDYKFNVYAADGTVERTVTREFEPYERQDIDRKLMETIMEGASSQFPFPIETHIEDIETPVGNLIAHHSGETWVLTARGSRNQPEGVLATWDVFDPDGHFVRQVQVRCPGNGRKDGIFFVGDDRLLVVHGLTDALGAQFGGGAGDEQDEEAQPIEVVCYRIEG